MSFLLWLLLGALALFSGTDLTALLATLFKTQG